MITYTIYGTQYQIVDVDGPIDGYAYKGEFVDDQPSKGKLVGTVMMEDGSVIECYKGSFPLIPVIIGVVAIVILAVVAYFLFFRKSDEPITGTFLSAKVDKNVVTFNGVMSARDGVCSIGFVNGDTEAIVEITGEDLSSEQVTLAPGEVLQDISIFTDSKEGVVSANLKVTCGDKSENFPVLVELPDNNNNYENTDEVHGVFSGEVILR